MLTTEHVIKFSHSNEKSKKLTNANICLTSTRNNYANEKIKAWYDILRLHGLKQLNMLASICLSYSTVARSTVITVASFSVFMRKKVHVSIF